MTKDRLNLFCLVDGEPQSNVFSVKPTPADTVDDLKKLIKAEKTPRFDDVAADELTLWRVSIPVVPANKHKPIVLNEVDSPTELDPTDDIADVFAETPPKKTIHIIVQRPPPDRVSEYDYVQFVPSPVIGHQQLPSPTTRSGHPSVSVTPSSVKLWPDFMDCVRRMELERTPQYPRPKFRDDRIFLQEATLHELFAQDFGVVELLPPGARTIKIMALLHGSPDLVCMRAQGGFDDPTAVLFPIEIKRPIRLRSDNLVEDYTRQWQSGGEQGPIGPLSQIFGYMRLNGFRYGVLTTYEKTWFIKRTMRHTKDLVVSPTISSSGTGPTLLQCYLWFIRQAHDDEWTLDTPTDEEKDGLLERDDHQGDRRGPEDREYKPSGRKGKLSSIFRVFPKTRSRTRTGNVSRATVVALDNLELISWDDESAQTYRASWKDRDVVLKKCDIWNQHPIVEELEHEARVYQVLQKLQGYNIPKLAISGIADGMEMILVTDFIGVDISHERLDYSDKKKIREALSAIHSLGVLHGDIRPQNILVKREGQVRRFFFIDFGLSQFTTDKERLQQEADILSLRLGWPHQPLISEMCAALVGKVAIVGWKEPGLEQGTSHNIMSMEEFMNVHINRHSIRNNKPIAPLFSKSKPSGLDLVFFIRIDGARLVPIFVQLKLRQGSSNFSEKDWNAALSTVSAPKIEDHAKTLRKYCPDNVYISMIVAYPTKWTDKLPAPSELPKDSSGIQQIVINISDGNFSDIFLKEHLEFIDRLKNARKRSADDDDSNDEDCSKKQRS
ncbi:hypothetical protein BGW39_007526 [Mortierella sp. 14UC]|nr:hypothetical protein BGW39_007526 [Mortierella sp. 14UC]